LLAAVLLLGLPLMAWSAWGVAGFGRSGHTKAACSERGPQQNDEDKAAYWRVVMSDASDFLAKWVHKNITPTTAHIHNDTLTAGRLAEECLWEAQEENLSRPLAATF
jgi:hypothetical protein